MRDISGNAAYLYGRYVPDPSVHLSVHNPHARYSVPDAYIDQTCVDYYLSLLRYENSTFLYPYPLCQFRHTYLYYTHRFFSLQEKRGCQATSFRNHLVIYICISIDKVFLGHPSIHIILQGFTIFRSLLP